MGRKKGAIRPSTPETAEKNAIAYHRACMCGCGKGCSSDGDELVDPTQADSNLTGDERFQQSCDIFHADEFARLQEQQSGGRRSVERS